MSKEKDKILRTLEHIAITFDKLGYSPTIPIFKGHQDFEYLFKLELGTIKELCNQQDQRIAELEEQLKNAIVPKFKVGDKAYAIIDTTFYTGVFPVDIVGIMLGYKVYDGQHTTNQNYVRVFATEEEAKLKLEELRGKHNE